MAKEPVDEGLVMLCVRVKTALRRRVKLVAATQTRSIQELTAEAIEAVCRQHQM